MDYVKDFDLDDDYDLIITGGDFLISESDSNHVVVLLESYMGAFKQFPLVGLGIRQYEAASINPQVLKRDIQVQLESDNYKVDRILVNPDYTYTITAKRI